MVSQSKTEAAIRAAIAKTQYEESQSMKRPIEFYQDAWTQFNNDTRDVPGYTKAIDAFAASGKKHNVSLSGCMTNKTQALSHMKDDVKRKVEK